MPFSRTAVAHFAVLGIICAVFVVPEAAGRSSIGLQNVSSYTIELYFTSFSGLQVKHSTIVVARRSDGSRSEVREQPFGGISGERLVHKSITFANGVSLDLRNDTRAKFTVRHDTNSPEWISHVLDAIDPASDCRRNFHGKSWSAVPLAFEGHESIKGYDAVRTRFTEPNGDIVTEWRSPAFGCEVVQEDRVMPNGTVEHQIPVLLQMGDPQMWYFDIPIGYRESQSGASLSASMR